MEKPQDINEFLNTDEVIAKINREIDILENKIDKGIAENRKLHFLRNLKISLITSRRILPYIITGGLTFGMFAFFNRTPFYLDDVKTTEDTLDKFFPTTTIEETVEEINSDGLIITYYGRWEKDNNGSYIRNVKVYNGSDINKGKLPALRNINVHNIDAILGKPINNYVEKKDNITKEEFNEVPSLKSTFYLVDDGSLVPIKETKENNIEDTALWVLATLMAESVPLWYRGNYSSFDYTREVAYAKKQFGPVDLSIDEEKLEKLKEEKQRIRG